MLILGKTVRIQDIQDKYIQDKQHTGYRCETAEVTNIFLNGVKAILKKYISSLLMLFFHLVINILVKLSWLSMLAM